MGQKAECVWTIVCKKGDTEWVADIDPDDKVQIAQVIEGMQIDQAIEAMRMNREEGA